MATNEQKQGLSIKKALARTMYLYGTNTQKQIAAEVGVSEQTMVEWCDKENWKALKTAMVNTTEMLLPKLQNMLATKIAEGERFQDDDDPDTNPDTDGIIKLAAAIEKLQLKTGPGQMYQTGIMFLQFLQRENPDLAKVIAPLFKAFINENLTA